jgi:glutamyl-tRNA synthetase|tara:strand:- start:126 stop:1880 length:1755 start_codon:yes stop_codon:yes gene_type:complete
MCAMIARESATRGNHRDMQTAQMAARSLTSRLTRGIGAEKGRKTREAAVMMATTRAGMRFSGPSRATARGRCAVTRAVDVTPPVSDGTVRVRFAPSPTGTLHVGGARTALFNYLYAKKMGGKFVLRVEDTDQARSTRESEESMIADLKWLGLDWDEGPDVGGSCGPYRQSERGDIYKALAEKLVASGHVYPCFCTDEELEAMKAEQEAKKLPPKYAGKWATASEEEVKEMMDKGVPFTYRFRVPEGERIEIDDMVRGKVGWDTDTLGDFVVLRSNGMPVYNFCVAVDDATMGITHVLRAEEHLPNTLRQALVYNALGFPLPTFAHMSLILAPDRSKLSKRHGATSVGQFKEEGYLSKTMVNYLSLLGWNDGTEQEIYEKEELENLFSVERINKSPAVFDKVKLNWMNGQHLRLLPDSDVESLVGNALAASGVLKESTGPTVQAIIPLIKDSIELVEDAVPQVEAMFDYPLKENMSDDAMKKVLEDDFEPIVEAIIKAHESGELAAAVKEGTVKKIINATGKELGRKGKRLFMPFRIALTGRMQGPDVGEVLTLLGKAAGSSDKIVSLDDRIATLKAAFPATVAN